MAYQSEDENYFKTKMVEPTETDIENYFKTKMVEPTETDIADFQLEFLAFAKDFVKYICGFDANDARLKKFATEDDLGQRRFNLSEDEACSSAGVPAKLIYAPPDDKYPKGSYHWIIYWAYIGELPIYDTIDALEIHKLHDFKYPKPLVVAPQCYCNRYRGYSKRCRSNYSFCTSCKKESLELARKPYERRIQKTEKETCCCKPNFFCIICGNGKFAELLRKNYEYEKERREKKKAEDAELERKKYCCCESNYVCSSCKTQKSAELAHKKCCKVLQNSCKTNFLGPNTTPAYEDDEAELVALKAIQTDICLPCFLLEGKQKDTRVRTLCDKCIKYIIDLSGHPENYEAIAESEVPTDNLCNMCNTTIKGWGFAVGCCDTCLHHGNTRFKN